MASADERQRSPTGFTDEAARYDIGYHRRVAAEYDQLVSSRYAVYHEYSLYPFLDRASATTTAGLVLDLGCGTGVVTLALAERGFNVVGVDHSPEMLEVARRKAVRAGLVDRCRFEIADVRRLSYVEGHFSGVTCQGVLHHLPDLESCVGELARVLRPGGFFYISEPCRDVTPLKSLIRTVKTAVGRQSLPTETTHTQEEPISSSRLIRVLDELALEYRIEYLTDLAPLRNRLTASVYLAFSKLVSFPWRSRGGDILFVYGLKSASPSS